MENKEGTGIHIARRPAQIFALFHFPFSILLLTAGCGAPGDPVPLSPPVPAAIKDLTAHQAGDGVQLSFTLPSNSISGEKLPAPPAVEILRGTVRPDGSADAKSFRVVYTIPGALVDSYRADGQVRFTDPIAPEETKSHPGGAVTYCAETDFRGFECRLAARASCSGSHRFRGGSRNRVCGRIDLAGPGPHRRRGARASHHRLSNLPLGNSSFRSRFVS